MREGWVVNVGLMGYAEAARLQQRIVAARKAEAVPDVLVICEHPHVITLGATAGASIFWHRNTCSGRWA